MLGIQEKIGLWAYRRFQDIHGLHGIPPKPWSQKLVEAECSVLEFLMPRCWDKECKERGEPCILRGYGEGDEVAYYWYCNVHAPRHGFCFSCGEFWGGTESFDFGPGYCSNCAPELEQEDYDPDMDFGWEYEI